MIKAKIHRLSRYPIERHSFLRKSFVHLEGIGPRTEAHLWSIGIDDWEKLAIEAPKIFKTKRLTGILRSIEAATAAWSRGELYHFHKTLSGNERWRIIPGGYEDIAYFDIEATGNGMPPRQVSTAIAFLFRGEVYQEYEYERKRELIDWILSECSMLCSFNGGSYDVPFLANEFSRNFEIAHIDLCPWLRRQGHKGGLKAIQKSFIHLHQRSSLDITGFDAVRLWRMHHQGIEGALDALLTYNAEDVLILAPLLVEAFNHELQKRQHIKLDALPAPFIPLLRTYVSDEVYRLLRMRNDLDIEVVDTGLSL